MPVRLTDSDGNINYLVPAPFINISKAYQKTGDGEIIGATYNITLSGKLLADRGSPKKMDHLLQQKALLVFKT